MNTLYYKYVNKKSICYDATSLLATRLLFPALLSTFAGAACFGAVLPDLGTMTAVLAIAFQLGAGHRASPPPPKAGL